MSPRVSQSRSLSVAVPWPAPPASAAIVPVFLPFFGCPRRCLFCAQEAQTGQPAASGAKLPALLAAARETLARRAARGLPPARLAFYGGTFTALPPEALAACLAFAERARHEGLITSFRCSTRPDAVDAGVLRRLAAAGCATVELGIQSFSDVALGLAGRAYDGARARLACARVADAGLEPVVQLLPGMPGVGPRIFLEDVRQALGLGVRALRFYPCLVLAGTGLEALWREGAFEPWAMETTLETLAEGWLLARGAGATVLRMGVAPEEDLARALLAGPWHPALGSRVLGRALLRAVAAALRLCRRLGAGGPLLVEAPTHVQGHFWGHGGELRAAWARLGVGEVRFVSAPVLRLLHAREREAGAAGERRLRVFRETPARKVGNLHRSYPPVSGG